MLTIGIDPGISGAICFMEKGKIIEVYGQNNLEVFDRIDIGEWVTLTLIPSE